MMAFIAKNIFFFAVPAILFANFVAIAETHLNIPDSEPNNNAGTKSAGTATFDNSKPVLGAGKAERITDLRGCPVPSMTASQTVGVHGNILLQDTNLLEHLAHFNRERIPERVVHARGAGAHGTFTVTHDISKYTKMKIFSAVGKETPMMTRFSITIMETGGSDVIRDTRGFALKFYTEDGNWDLVGNSLPLFPVRDPMLFPLLLHSRKRNPRSRLFDTTAEWDFDGLRPETTFHKMVQMSGLGIPDGFRHMDGHGIHTFKLVNSRGKKVYAKFHYMTDQGIRNLTNEEAANIQATDPDYSTRDLYDSIEQGNFPSYSLKVQVMTYEQAATYRWNPFDTTKIWIEKDFPMMPVGKIVLNRTPADAFAEIEQAAFAVGNMVPGIEPSPDKMLQSRMFAYSDAHRYRLGVNHNLIVVNRPIPSVKVKTYVRDGIGVHRSVDNGNGSPNYFPNSFDPSTVDPSANSTRFHLDDDVARYDTKDEDNFSQADYYWKNEFDDEQRQVVVSNYLSVFKNLPKPILDRVLQNYDQVGDLGKMMRAGLAAATR